MPGSPQEISVPDRENEIFDSSPSSLAQRGVLLLSKQGRTFIVWGALLDQYHRVPRVVIDISFLVPDNQLEAASETLTRMGLPISPDLDLFISTSGDFYTKGVCHCLTRSTTPGSMCCLHLVPASFPNYAPNELLSVDFEELNTQGQVPRASAVFASIIRMLTMSPQHSPERDTLEVDLELCLNHSLLGIIHGSIDDEEQWQEQGMDAKLAKALEVVEGWRKLGEWRDGEEWIGDMLLGLLNGTKDIDDIPACVAGA